jgi:hypothetical protein
MYQFIKRILTGNRGTASEIKSTAYQNYDILGRPFSGLVRGGHVYVIADTHTVGAGTYVDQAAENASGTVHLFVHRAGWVCIWAFVSTNGIGASAGSGVTLAIGDSSTADKYITATDFDVAGAVAYLNSTGHLYAPTADKIVTATYSAVAPVAGQKFYYTFMFLTG